MPGEPRRAFARRHSRRCPPIPRLILPTDRPGCRRSPAILPPDPTARSRRQMSWRQCPAHESGWSIGWGTVPPRRHRSAGNCRPSRRRIRRHAPAGASAGGASPPRFVSRRTAGRRRILSQRGRRPKGPARQCHRPAEPPDRSECVLGPDAALISSGAVGP